MNTIPKVSWKDFGKPHRGCCRLLIIQKLTGIHQRSLVKVGHNNNHRSPNRSFNGAALSVIRRPLHFRASLKSTKSRELEGIELKLDNSMWTKTPRETIWSRWPIYEIHINLN